MTQNNLEYEKKWLEKGCAHIAGVDEVGRGPLAGPVTVCAVIMPLGEGDIIPGITDSKKLSAKKREKLCAQILEKAVACKVVSLPPQYIDEVNILRATKEAMSRALEGLAVAPDAALIDAVQIQTRCPVEAIIKGDLLSYSISCASIVAKVTRDKYMDELALTYPQYGFEKNKGYGTAAHIAAIKEYGITPEHRRTFVKNFI